MAWSTRVLVMANVTAEAPELLAELEARAARTKSEFVLVLPAPAGGRAGRDAARERLEEALEHLRAHGLEVEGRVGDHDAIAALIDAWDPREFDEVIVSTLPTGLSKWLQVDLPRRVRRLTDAPVTHVISAPPPRQLAGEPPARARAPRDPFSALTGRRD